MIPIISINWILGVFLVHSRRGDLEILGYNLVQWLTGKLPWEDDIADPETVAESKKRAMSNIGQFLKSSFAPNNPPGKIDELWKITKDYCRSVYSNEFW